MGTCGLHKKTRRARLQSGRQPPYMPAFVICRELLCSCGPLWAARDAHENKQAVQEKSGVGSIVGERGVEGTRKGHDKTELQSTSMCVVGGTAEISRWCGERTRRNSGKKFCHFECRMGYFYVVLVVAFTVVEILVGNSTPQKWCAEIE